MKKCDFLTTGVTPTFERQKILDLTLPWMNDCYGLLFAVHEDMANVEAIVKPFQWPVCLKKRIAYSIGLYLMIHLGIEPFRFGLDCPFR